MPAPPKIPICILAGGASRRFGEDKALAKLQGKLLIAHVLDRLVNQTTGPIAINATEAGPYARFGLPILPDDKWAGHGPLAGIVAAMEWSSTLGYSNVVTVAVDLPFVPANFVSKLAATGAPTIAATAQRWHPVNAFWRSCDRDSLESYLKSDLRSAHGWAQHCKAGVALFDEGAGGVDPFWNVNTPDEMAQAEKMLKLIRTT